MKIIMKQLMFLFLMSGLVSAASTLKVGVVDLQKVLFFYDEFKILRIELANRSSRYENELNEMEKELAEIKKKLQSPSISEENKQELEGDFSRKMFDLQRKYEQYKKKLDESKEEDLEKIKGIVFQEISKIANVRKLDYVFDQKQLYFGNAVDLTDDLIDILNRKEGSSPKGATAKRGARN